MVARRAMSKLEPIAKIAREKGREKQNTVLILWPFLANLKGLSTAAAVD